MPSKHSPASKTDAFDSDAKKMLETKNDMTINSLIKGMTNMERIDHWIRTEAEGQCRKGRGTVQKKDYRQTKPQKDGVTRMICYICQRPLQEENRMYAYGEPIHPECRCETESKNERR